LPLEIANFDRDVARVYGRVRVLLEKKGTPIGALDVMIGAHALALGATLATHNTREFSRIKGLTIVDWLEGAQ
jgi:tRNA(fMet)-specific endonuclease VapC